MGELFAGIGGFGLGLERAGMEVIWQSEIDPYASAVLRKHWPHVPNHGDIRSIRGGDVERPDVLCGGFPCQDISNAGKRAGIDGERSGLWSEYARVIGELRPRYVIVENVAALLGRGLERVLGDLAALGFDAEWHCIPAAAIGAPHRRDRLWIVAHARRERGGAVRTTPGTHQSVAFVHDQRRGADVADADRAERWPLTEGRDVAHRHDARREEATSRSTARGSHLAVTNEGWPLDNAVRGRHWISPQSLRSGRDGAELASWWRVEPDVGRVAHGVRSRVDRLRCLGNAIVPQIAEVIGRAILDATPPGAAATPQGGTLTLAEPVARHDLSPAVSVFPPKGV